MILVPLMNVPLAELRSSSPHRVLGEEQLGVAARGVPFGQLQIALRLPAEDHVGLDRDLALVRDFDELGLIVGHM